MASYERTVTVLTIEGEDVHEELEFPDWCPWCHTSVLPVFRVAVYCSNELSRGGLIHAAFACPNSKCQRLFIARYSGRLNRSGYDLQRELYPVIFQKEEFSEEIAGLSSGFVEIFNQALAAEHYGLTHVAGMGFRKALEFLVKDFAKSERPDDVEDILQSHLAVCIRKYIDDVNIRQCAERAAWLGNDESHYLRLWVDKDIKDLKLLIRLTVNGVENVLLRRKYVEGMER